MTEIKPMNFTDDKIAGTVEVLLEISEQDVNYILSGAFEGGMTSQWCEIQNDRKSMPNRTEDRYLVDHMTMMLLNKETIKLRDTEDDKMLELTMAGLLNGIRLNHRNRPHDNDLEVADAITYDCIVQYAVFGEVVYG